MAKSVKKVIGVEIVEEAIQGNLIYNHLCLFLKDAKQNALDNGITNVEYIAAKVEDAMRTVFSKHVGPNDEVIAVLDPPRAGVHSSVIAAVRGCKQLSRLIYVSCNANAAKGNFVYV